MSSLLFSILKKSSTHGLLLIFCTILLLWTILSVPLFLYHAYDSDQSGKLGDTLGVMNSIFSALAFAGVIYSIIQQNTQISQQEREKVIDRVDNKFFLLLNSHREILKSMDLQNSEGKTIARGTDCFRIFYRQHFINMIKQKYKREKGMIMVPSIPVQGIYELEKLIDIYTNMFYRPFQGDLDHYFQNFYLILKIINDSEIQNKKEYISILRSQLSSYEVLLLFYNSLSHYGIKYKGIIEEYSLLQGIDEKLLINKEHDQWAIDGYSPRAFGVDKKPVQFIIRQMNQTSGKGIKF